MVEKLNDYGIVRLVVLMLNNVMITIGYGKRGCDITAHLKPLFHSTFSPAL